MTPSDQSRQCPTGLAAEAVGDRPPELLALSSVRFSPEAPAAAQSALRCRQLRAGTKPRRAQRAKPAGQRWRCAGVMSFVGPMDVQPGERTALREEENRPAPASWQVIASAVTGLARTAARPGPSRRSDAGQHPAADAAARAAGLPGRRSLPGRWRPAAARLVTGGRPRPPQRGQALPAAQRALAQGRAPWRNKTAPLRLGRVPGPQVVKSPGSARHSRMWPGRIQHSGSRPSASNCRRCRESVLSWRAARGRGRRRCRPGSAACTVMPAAASSSAAYRHPVRPSTRERDVIAAVEPRQPGPQVHPVRRADLPAPRLPGHGAGVAGGDLPPVDIQPAYDGHRDLLKLRRAHAAPGKLPTRSIVTRATPRLAEAASATPSGRPRGRPSLPPWPRRPHHRPHHALGQAGNNR